MKILLIIVIVIVVIAVLAWLGLQIKPKPFPAYPDEEAELEYVPLPDGLPAPVERFYTTLYSDEVPLVTSAVISGRADMRVNGITFPARFRFTHTAGQDYRHYIEATIYGLPLMQVNESYLDGKSRMELPFGITENEPKIDESANLGLWAESMWLPSLWVTDARVRWEPIDANSATLIVPFGKQENTFTVRFDPETSLLREMEAMRYREASDAQRIRWICRSEQWGKVGEKDTLETGSITWMDEGTPWATFYVEELLYNVDVEAYVRQKGI